MTATRWRDRYGELSRSVRDVAASARPTLAGFSACVDAVYRVGPAELETLAAASGDESWPARVSGALLERMRDGRGGELYFPWLEGPAWAERVLGRPGRLQIGGTGPQAAWTLAVLGGATVVPLTDRNADQLAVLHPETGLCADGAVVPVASVTPSGDPLVPRHVILEFTAGTRWSGPTLTRSSRIILRFAFDGVQRDEEFARSGVAADAAAGLVSGLNAIAPDDSTSAAWVASVVGGWRQARVPMVHLELAEYGTAEEIRAVVRSMRGSVTSLGLSLSELRAIEGGDADPVSAARDLAEYADVGRVCVHADDWALAVHRGDPEAQRAALLTGSLLAAARATTGEPQERPTVPADASYTDDLPPSGPCGDGWRADCVPAPYLPRPVSTIGLGDTFVAGLLLTPQPS